MIDLSTLSTATLLEDAGAIIRRPEQFSPELIFAIAGELRRRGFEGLEDRVILSAAKHAIPD